ncbi:MAG: hypothetical protein KIH69_001910 [Anaerolineae bacterium]|nr:hypothetical protein [Anaerolineae bacterium]
MHIGPTQTIHHDLLVAALHERGLCYLAPTPTGDEPSISDDDLILGLSASSEVRVRFALAGLFLLRPQLAELAASIVAQSPKLPSQMKAELIKQYVAAMYLQRLWRTRLRLKFGPRALIPERFIKDMGLPSADDMYGEHGLYLLCSRSPYNDWSSYEQVIELLLSQPCVHIDVADLVLDTQYLKRMNNG